MLVEELRHNKIYKKAKEALSTKMTQNVKFGGKIVPEEGCGGHDHDHDHGHGHDDELQMSNQTEMDGYFDNTNLNKTTVTLNIAENKPLIDKHNHHH